MRLIIEKVKTVTMVEALTLSATRPVKKAIVAIDNVNNKYFLKFNFDLNVNRPFIWKENVAAQKKAIKLEID
jgi:hypothetical protein